MRRRDSENSTLDHITFVHKALRTTASELINSTYRLKTGDNLKGINLAFTSWVSALVFYLEASEKYLEQHLKQLLHGRNYIGNNYNNTLIIWFMGLAKLNRTRQLKRIDDIFSILHVEIGKTSLITRTIQHLNLGILRLKIAQEDYLETQEESLIPLICKHSNSTQQLHFLKHILIDQESEDRKWMIKWVIGHLDSTNTKLISDLERRLDRLI
ncbi:MAG: hypothetical protein CL891_06075 [Dehalococcoidia bacterium]|nr:hypothetical protein [Dehalococcoidia bacterium]